MVPSCQDLTLWDTLIGQLSGPLADLTLEASPFCDFLHDLYIRDIVILNLEYGQQRRLLLFLWSTGQL